MKRAEKLKAFLDKREKPQAAGMFSLLHIKTYTLRFLNCVYMFDVCEVSPFLERCVANLFLVLLLSTIFCLSKGFIFFSSNLISFY